MMRQSCPSEEREGAGKARHRLMPAARLLKECRRQVPQVQPDDPAFPARSVLTVSFVLSLGIGLSCPHRPRMPSSNACELDLSVERPGPHDFAVRADRRSSGAAVTSIAAHLHVRDDAYVPLHEAGWREISTLSEKTKEIFFTASLTVRRPSRPAALLVMKACRPT